MKKVFAAVAASVLLIALAAQGQNVVKADQGRPGNQGPWPVTVQGGSNPADGGANAAPPYQCNIASPNKVTVVDGGGTITVPATAQAFRVYTLVCNSPLNASGTIISCRADGTAPGTVGALNVGDVLQLGDCITYTVPASRNILCVANSASASVNTYECF